MPPTTAERPARTLAPKQDLVKTITELKSQAESYVQQADDLYKLAEEDGRELTADEEDQIAEWLSQAEALQADVVAQTEETRRTAVRQMIAMTREHQSAMPDPSQVLNTGVLRRVTHMHPRWQDDPKRGWAHSGEFYASVIASAYPNSPMDERLVRMLGVASGMSQGVGADGGILVPPQFRTEIWQGMQRGIDNLLPMTDQYTITGESLIMPANAETSRATGSRYGGIRAYWLAEAEQKTGSFPRFRQMKLEPQELAVLVYVTDKLLRNAPALETYVSNAAREEILFLVNDAIIRGSGVGMPLGILNSGGLITVDAEVGQAADTITLENVNRIYGRMNARARNGAVWLINQEVEAQLETLSSVVGVGGVPVYLPMGPGGPTITESPNSRLKGRPVLPVEYASGVGDVGDIMFVNLNYYATGLQGAIKEDMSIHIRYLFNETALRFVFSCDGQPWVNVPLTPYLGTQTVSPFVTLAAR
jgi:HK97 family phage major capsid protein